MKQGTDSLTVYSNNMQKLWEKLQCLEPRRKCICIECKCDARWYNDETDASNRVMEFLMGLHDSYEAITSNN